MGRSAEEARQQCKDQGLKFVFGKNFRVHELFQAVREYPRKSCSLRKQTLNWPQTPGSGLAEWIKFF